MKIRDALVGVFAAIASALASIAVFNRAIKEDKPTTVASSAGSSGGASTEERHPAGFLPKKTPAEKADTSDETHKLSSEHRREVVPIPPGWSEPEPKEIPRPTYWPAVMAVGITFIFWGVPTSFIVSGIGLVVFAIALAGWIGDIRNENAHD